MYRQLLCIIFFVAFFKCGAQVTMTVQVPPAGVMLKKQLWNLALVYTGNTTIYAHINLTISDVVTDQPVITATSGTIVLPKGAKQVQADDIGPIQYQYPSSTVSDRDPDGFLAIGKYQACYTVILNDERNNTPLAEDCVSFEVEPLSPPVLNTPANEDTLQTKFPQFTWLPPTPLSLFSNLTYYFNIVEVQPGQNPIDAIQQNIPLYLDNNCTDIFINYPASGITLDTGKTYAWQVIAQNNFQPASQSEVWVFRITDSVTVNMPSSGKYIVLTNSDEVSNTFVVDNGYISVKYYSFDKAHFTDIVFKNLNGSVIKTVRKNIIYGDNYLTYPVSSTFQKGQVYVIEITDLQNKTHSASFSIK